MPKGGGGVVYRLGGEMEKAVRYNIHFSYFKKH